MTVTALEPWLDKKGLADHLGCGVRWIEPRLSEDARTGWVADREARERRLAA